MKLIILCIHQDKMNSMSINIFQFSQIYCTFWFGTAFKVDKEFLYYWEYRRSLIDIPTFIPFYECDLLGGLEITCNCFEIIKNNITLTLAKEK